MTYGVVIVFFIFCIVLTESRGPILGLVPSVLAMFIIYRNFKALPIIIIAPLILYSFFGVYPHNKTLIISLFLGSPTLILLASLGEILLLRARKNKIMLLLIIAPFYVPVLIFGIGTIDLVRLGYSPNHNFYILIGFFTIGIGLVFLAAISS